MKIIAAAGRERFIVEMSQDEIIKAAGFSSAFYQAWQKHNGGRDIQIGTEINVQAAYSYHERVRAHQDEAVKSARTLRALADMIDGALPEVVIPLVAEFAEVTGEGGAA